MKNKSNVEVKLNTSDIAALLEEQSDEVFKNEFLPKIDEVNNKYNTFFSPDLWDECAVINKKLEEATDNYQNNFNHAAYWALVTIGIFFACILIIPAYWAIKKLKTSKKRKELLQQKLNDTKLMKTQFLLKAVESTDFYDYWTEMEAIKRYEDFGPLNEAQLNFFKSNYDLNVVDDFSYNTSTTSWGVIDDQKLFLKVAYQKHQMSTKTYSGAISVTYDKDNGNKTETKTTVVEASIVRSFPEFSYFQRNWIYMSSCNGLRLNLEDASKNRKYHKDKNHTELENKVFEDSFNWSYNDSTAYKMIFTPYTQEYYVNNAFDQKSYFNKYFSIFKVNNFISNNYVAIKNNFELKIMNLINNPQTDLDSIDFEMKNICSWDVKNYYEETILAWFLPILKNEDQKDIVNKLKNAAKVPTLSTFHYAFKKLIGINVTKGVTDTIHKVNSPKQMLTPNHNKVHVAEIEGLTYDAFKRTDYVARTYEGGCIEVPVDWYEYIERHESANMLIGFCENKWVRDWRFDFFNIYNNDELNIELDALIQKYFKQGVYIGIEKSLIALLAKNIDHNSLFEIYDEIVSILKKYN